MLVRQNFQIHEPRLSKVCNEKRHLCCTVFVPKIEMTCSLCTFTPMKFYNMTLMSVTLVIQPFMSPCSISVYVQIIYLLFYVALK